MTTSTDAAKPAKKAAAKPKAAPERKGNPGRTKAYSAAIKRLREAHRDEFERYLADECAARGVEYKRRLSAEEKAEKTIETLLSEHPELRERFVTEVTPDGYPTGPDPV